MPNPDPMEDTKVTFRVPGGTWDRVKSTRLSVWNADGGELFLEMNSQFRDGRGTLFHNFFTSMALLIWTQSCALRLYLQVTLR